MNTTIWYNYSFLAVLIIVYIILQKPRGKTIRNIWILYAVIGAAIGMYSHNLKNKEDNI